MARLRSRRSEDGALARNPSAALAASAALALTAAPAASANVKLANGTPTLKPCQTAWTILVRRQADRAAIFAWLYVVAIHEAYRLSAIERRGLHLEDLAIEGD